MNYAPCMPDGHGGAVCACLPGYTGSHCELAYGQSAQPTGGPSPTNVYQTDPCMSSPCLNGGFCIPATGFGYVCMCPIGTSGFNCDFYINQSCFFSNSTTNTPLKYLS
jgi:hypothetical protein